MTTTTLAGPLDAICEASDALAEAGYVVLDEPARTGIDPAEGEAFLSIDGEYPDADQLVRRFGWRTRITQKTIENEVPLPVVAIGAKGQG
jgi:hypothetical protein